MTEGQSLFLAALLMMAISLMVVAYFFKRPAIAFGSAAGWVLFSLFAYTISTGPWDIYFGTFWFGMAMVIVAIYEAMSIRTATEVKQDAKQSMVERRIAKTERFQAKREIYERAMETDTQRGIRKRRESTSPTRLV